MYQGVGFGGAKCSHGRETLHDEFSKAFEKDPDVRGVGDGVGIVIDDIAKASG